MAFSHDILQMLVCPACKGSLTFGSKQDSLKQDFLRCVECHRVYPVRDGIPVLLIDQATIEK